MEDQGRTGETDAGGGDPPMPSTAIRKNYTQRLHEILGHRMNSLTGIVGKATALETMPRGHPSLETPFSGTFRGSIVNTGTSTVSLHPFNLRALHGDHQQGLT